MKPNSEPGTRNPEPFFSEPGTRNPEPLSAESGKPLFAKLWDDHLVHSEPGKPDLLYIDCHLVHEVTSPQAFEGLRLARRSVRRPALTFATVDHNVPTSD